LGKLENLGESKGYDGKMFAIVQIQSDFEHNEKKKKKGTGPFFLTSI